MNRLSFTHGKRGSGGGVGWILFLRKIKNERVKIEVDGKDGITAS